MTKTDRIAAAYRISISLDRLLLMSYDELISAGRKTNSSFAPANYTEALKAMIMGAVYANLDVISRRGQKQK